MWRNWLFAESHEAVFTLTHYETRPVIFNKCRCEAKLRAEEDLLPATQSLGTHVSHQSAQKAENAPNPAQSYDIWSVA